MNTLCTFYISNKKLGTIVSIPNNIESIQTLDMKPIDSTSAIRFKQSNSILILTDKGEGIRIDLQSMESKVVDDPLRKLSSNTYVVITDRTVMYKDKIYQHFGSLPILCQWKAIPMVKMDDIFDYKSTNIVDDIFLKEGYTKELKDAAYILVPPSWDDISPTCTPYDLLMKKVDHLSTDGATFHSFSGRVGTISGAYEVEGRYIYLTNTPTFIGKYSDSPFTYNMETLIYKYGLLQDRLEIYGSNKVESICASMRSLGDRLKDVTNQFMASSIYDDVVTILEKAKHMD